VVDQVVGEVEVILDQGVLVLEVLVVEVLVEEEEAVHGK
jgi:hypothetical protein